MGSLGRVRVVVPEAADPMRSLAHLVRQLQEAGRNVIYVSADRPYDLLMQLHAAEGVAVQDVHFVDAVSSLNGTAPLQRPGNATFLPSPTMLEMLAMRVEQAAVRRGPGTHVIVDSIDTLCLYNGTQPVQEFSHYLANRLRSQGVHGDFVVRPGPNGERLQDLVSSFTDDRIQLAPGVH